MNFIDPININPNLIPNLSNNNNILNYKMTQALQSHYMN